MATNSRTRNPADPAVSAVEAALGPEADEGFPDSGQASSRRGDLRATDPRGEATRRGSDLTQRPQASRIPAPPRRGDAARRAAEAGGPSSRRSEPVYADDDIAANDERSMRGASSRDDQFDDAPAPPRPRAAERLRSRFAANDDRRLASSQFGLQRTPSRLIYPVAAILSAGWGVIVLAFVLTRGAFG